MALLKKKKDTFKKIRALALKTNEHAAKFGHDMLWKVCDEKNAIGSCRNCNQKVEVVADGRRMTFKNAPKQCRPMPRFTTPAPQVYVAPVAAPSAPRPKPRTTVAALRAMLANPNVRSTKPTPDPKGFYKRSPIDRVKRRKLHV